MRRLATGIVTIACSAMPCVTGCRDELPIDYETQHLRIGLESADPLCRGDLEALERLIGRVEDELYVEMDEVTTIYIWDDDVWFSGPHENCANHGVLGCFDPDRSTIWTSRSSVGHELVHAVVGKTKAAAFFNESIADVYGGDQTWFGRTAPTDNTGTTATTTDRTTGRHFVRWLRERWGPDRLGQILAADKDSFDEFEAIYGLSFEAAEALYFEDAPYGYSSLYGCDGPQLTEVVGLAWAGEFELDCEDGLDTHGFGTGMGTHRRFDVDEPGYYTFNVDADFFFLARCSPARIEEPPKPTDFLADAPVQHATYPSEAFRYYEGRVAHTLHLDVGTHDIAVGLLGHDVGTVEVAIWPALIQPAGG